MRNKNLEKGKEKNGEKRFSSLKPVSEMNASNSTLNPEHFPEAKLAIVWLNISIPSLLKHNNANFFDFSDYYSEYLKIIPKEKVFINGKEVDAMTEPEDRDTIQLNISRYSKMGRKEKVAFWIHELFEGYSLSTGIFCFADSAHNLAEYLEGLYRKQNNLSPCRFALSKKETHIMQKAMNIFQERIHSMQRYGGDIILERLSKSNLFSFTLREGMKKKKYYWCINLAVRRATKDTR